MVAIMEIFIRFMFLLAIASVMGLFIAYGIAVDNELKPKVPPAPPKPSAPSAPSAPPRPPHRPQPAPEYQFFPPNAAISLTDDNSTVFPARPAAFGTALPKNGMSAALWIGAGFGEDVFAPQGELGCSDIPGWDGKKAFDDYPNMLIEGLATDGTDEYLEMIFTDALDWDTRTRKTVNTKAGDAAVYRAAESDEPAANEGAVSRDDNAKPASAPSTVAQVSKDASQKEPAVHSLPHHSDIQSLQEGAEIGGKIVLLRRGGCGFLSKVLWAQRRGAVGVIVGDDRKGGPLVQMYASGDTSIVTIPSVFTSHTTAHLLSALVASAAQKDAANDKAGGRDVKGAALPLSLATGTSGKWAHAATGTEGGTGHALYVTIAPTRNAIPFVDMLLVILASPVLAIVLITGVLLFIRSQYRRRAWRAPKELVRQLPVHIFVPPSSTPAEAVLTAAAAAAGPSAAGSSSTPRSLTPPTEEPTVTTPLLCRQGPAASAAPSTGPHQPRFHQLQCIVCLEDYVAGDRIMCLPCGHEFHAGCITPWLTTRRRTCPICKGDVVKSTTPGDAA